MSIYQKRVRSQLEEDTMSGNEHPGLDAYEQEILVAYESGNLKKVSTQADYQSMARETLANTCNINIHLQENDLAALQRKALREGIPCQTLIASILHKYASGFLREAPLSNRIY